MQERFKEVFSGITFTERQMVALEERNVIKGSWPLFLFQA